MFSDTNLAEEPQTMIVTSLNHCSVFAAWAYIRTIPSARYGSSLVHSITNWPSFFI
ncbi:MAG: hypothetical protein R6V16_07825 [Bacteroidales bacterium]